MEEVYDTGAGVGRLKVKLSHQNCVDIQNNTPQYLGVRISLTLEVLGGLAN